MRLRGAVIGLAALMLLVLTTGGVAAGGAPAARAPARMLVTAREWSLTLSRGTAPAGPLTVQLYNRGQDAHNLNIRRLDRRKRMAGPRQRVSLTQSGGLSQATWHLKPGRYELYCSLPGHVRQGMRAFLTVTAG